LRLDWQVDARSTSKQVVGLWVSIQWRESCGYWLIWRIKCRWLTTSLREQQFEDHGIFLQKWERMGWLCFWHLTFCSSAELNMGENAKISYCVSVMGKLLYLCYVVKERYVGVYVGIHQYLRMWPYSELGSCRRTHFTLSILYK
jgi:hypothetical protein